jgi:SAM-dependent methyltransferase
VLSSVAQDGWFLEIGPAYEHTLARRDGFSTKNADHLDRAGLMEKYRGSDGVDVDAIEDVDYVLTPGVPLASCTDERFDLVLASHVLEHTVSLVDFVNDCADLLNPGGTLALIVPDKRFCFDRFRDRSSLGEVIDAASADRRAHSAGTLTEVALYTTRRRGSIAWTPASRGPYEWVYGLAAARELAAAADEETYVDVHRWVFTPHHLRLLLHDLAETGHIGLRESFFHGTVGFEFFVNLRADGPGPGLTRDELVALADEESRSLDRPRFSK